MNQILNTRTSVSKSVRHRISWEGRRNERGPYSFAPRAMSLRSWPYEFCQGPPAPAWRQGAAELRTPAAGQRPLANSYGSLRADLQFGTCIALLGLWGPPDSPGSLLDFSWGCLRAIFGHLGAVLGLSWAVLGLSWGSLGRQKRTLAQSKSGGAVA